MNQKVGRDSELSTQTKWFPLQTEVDQIHGLANLLLVGLGRMTGGGQSGVSVFGGVQPFSGEGGGNRAIKRRLTALRAGRRGEVKNLTAARVVPDAEDSRAGLNFRNLILSCHAIFFYRRVTGPSMCGHLVFTVPQSSFFQSRG